MKKYILVMLLGLIAVVGFAQAPVVLTTTGHSNALDTVTNTATVSTTPIRASTFRTGIVFQMNALKISGTVAGTIGVYGSLDITSPTHWNLIGSTTSASDASASYRLATTEKWYWYRVSWIGTGTMSASVAGKYWTY